VFSGLDQGTLLWIGIALLVILAAIWLAISMSCGRDTLNGASLLLDRDEDELDEDEDETRAG
jgi:hypothetical protein